MNEIVRLTPGDPDGDLLRQLLSRRPDLLDDVADRIADRMADQIAEQVVAKLAANAAPMTLNDVPDDEHAPDIDDRTTHFIEQIQRERAALIGSTDPTVWGTRVVAAAGNAAAATAAFAWALSPTCPTSYWRDYASPMSPPREARGARSGPIHQLIAEWKVSDRQPDAARRIDDVVSEVHTALRKVRGRDCDQRSVPARKNALDLLKAREWDSDRIVEIITWGVQKRPHWRNTLAGVPAPRTFDKIHGDWTTSGNDLSDVDATMQRNIELLVDGWRIYYAQRINSPAVQCGNVSRRNVADCLIGTDGAGEIDVPQLKSVVRWLCDRSNTQARFYLNGSNEFPPITSVRRALLAMTTPQNQRPNQRVAATNHIASGAVHSADISEV